MISRYIFMTAVSASCFLTWWEISDLKSNLRDIEQSIAILSNSIKFQKGNEMPVSEEIAKKRLRDFIQKLRKERGEKLTKEEEKEVDEYFACLHQTVYKSINPEKDSKRDFSP